MKPISLVRLLFMAVTAIGTGLRPKAGPVTPDPADCFFQVLPIDRLNVPTAFVGVSAQVVALSGDGRTALVAQTQVIESQGPPLPPGTPDRVEDEFIFRDGVRSALTHWEVSNLFKHGGPIESGPRWASVGLPFDGSRVATTKTTAKVPHAVLLTVPDKTEGALPLSSVNQLSADGQWVVGVDADGKLVRLHRPDGQVDFITDTPASSAIGTFVARISDDGQVVSGSGSVMGGFYWTKVSGLRPTASFLPAGFEVSATDGSGLLLVGRLSLSDHVVPAYWTRTSGLVQLTTVLDGQDGKTGGADLVSGDGQLIFGFIKGTGGAFPEVVWTRDGTVYPLSALIRGVDLGGLEIVHLPSAVSRDGRTIGGVAHTMNGTPVVYLAGLALPGEGPHVSLTTAAGGARSLKFRAKSGFRYQIQTAASLGGWGTMGSEIVGDDASHDVVLPDQDAGSGFFRVVVNP